MAQCFRQAWRRRGTCIPSFQGWYVRYFQRRHLVHVAHTFSSPCLSFADWLYIRHYTLPSLHIALAAKLQHCSLQITSFVAFTRCITIAIFLQASDTPCHSTAQCLTRNALRKATGLPKASNSYLKRTLPGCPIPKMPQSTSR